MRRYAGRAVYYDYGNIVSQENQGDFTTYQYDLNARLTYKCQKTGNVLTISKYTYDANDSQVSIRTIKSTDKLATYTYNPTGLRDSITVNGQTKRQILDVGNVVAETDKYGTLQATYLYGTDLVSKKDSLGKEYFYFKNAHNDVVALTDRQGKVCKTYEYDSYGNFTSKGEAIDNPFTYFGQYFDEETGNYYLRARYYSPSQQRFISEDSYRGAVTDPLSLNLYLYCSGNPVMYTDPSGNKPLYPVPDDKQPTDADADLGSLKTDLYLLEHHEGWEADDLVPEGFADLTLIQQKRALAYYNYVNVKSGYYDEVKKNAYAMILFTAIDGIASHGGNKGMGNNGNNVVNYAKYKEVLRTAEAANSLVDSLKQTSKLPSNYITKAQAEALGWKPGKAIGNYAPGKQIGGDKYNNTTGLLPRAKGREWYEADVGLTDTMSRAKQPGTRLMYSNDGQIYITYDHYKSVHFIGTWK